jgi:hypothetical protein
MSDFFERLEAQRRLELSKVGFGAAVGVLAVVAFFRFALEPSSIIDYAPTLTGILPGASIAAAIIDYRENARIATARRTSDCPVADEHEIMDVCQESQKKPTES